MDKRPNSFFEIRPTNDGRWVWEFWDANYVLLARSILYDDQTECIEAAKYLARNAARATIFTEPPDVLN